MSLLLIEGFEHMNDNGGQFTRRYDVVSGGTTPDTGRISGVSAVVSNLEFSTPSFGLSTTLVVGFAMKLFSDPLSTGRSFSFTKGGLEQIRIEVVGSSPDFELKVSSGATDHGTTAQNFAYNVWHYFELKVVIDATTGSFELRRNEQNVLSDAGPIDTANEGTSGADGMHWRWTGSGGNPRMDDWYILDDGGTSNNDFLGDVFITGAKPTADGTTNQWTRNSGAANYENVDDPTIPSDGTNTNESDTNGQIDLYAYSNLVGISGTILGVVVESQMAMETAGTRTVRSRYRDNDAVGESPGGNHVVDGTGFQTFAHIFEANPVTVSAWTLAAIDNGEFGVEVVS